MQDKNMTMEDITKVNDFMLPQQEPSIIKVIGVGGGGNNAVKHMYEQGVQNISFVVCNTDDQALRNSPVPMKLTIGPTVTKGLGAGGRPEVAKAAAEESVEDIRRLFDDNTQMVFITAGMGGGTGTGAAAVVARVAKEKGLLTVGIVTIPFLFEGKAKILKALDGADEMSKYVDALLIVHNERLIDIYPDLDFRNAFGKADDTLSIAALGISEMITTDHGIINIDFNDVNTTLRNGGAAIISIGYGEGENRIRKAIDDALQSPLLRDHNISTSKRILFNVYYNPDSEHPVVMSEAQELTDFTSQIYPGVDIIWGLAHDKSLGDKVKITLLAAGFEINSEIVTTIDNMAQEPKKPKKPTLPQPADDDDQRILEQYGPEKFKIYNDARETQKYIILRPDQFTDDSIIEIFESTPTFTREPNVAEQLKQKKTSEKAVGVQSDNHSNQKRNDEINFMVK